MNMTSASLTGIYAYTDDEYHRDPCPVPSLTASMANLLLNRSPAHAREAHPKLNPHFQRKTEEKFEIGTLAHSLFLQGNDIAYIVHEKDWRSKDAKEAREYARSIGRVPLLAHQADQVHAMVDALRTHVAELDVQPPLFSDGESEQTLVWQEGDVMCRARLDWLADDYRSIDDLKTTARSANPEHWSPFSLGYDVQAAMYLRGLRAVTGAEAEWRWVAVETQPPYAVSVLGASPDLLALAEAKVEWAINKWRECLTNDRWEGYPKQVAYPTMKPWVEADWLAREAREQDAA